tara:strand:- start:6034 stop:6513 length:480 start_codon:yes stop_codon:yes gene_type:complete
MNDQQKLIQAMIEKPSTFHVEVEDNSMLPENLKDKKEIDFVVKPPCLGALAMCSELLQEVPEDILNEQKELTLNDVLPYANIMVKVICRISWNRQDDYPEWYEKFLLANATTKEIFMIFKETAIKSQSDFFLHSFQIASQTNPMMMRKISRNDSTPTDS